MHFNFVLISKKSCCCYYMQPICRISYKMTLAICNQYPSYLHKCPFNIAMKLYFT